MEETLAEHGKSLAAPLIFMIVVTFQFLSRHVEHKKKRGSVTDMEIQLRTEIKQLYKEASSLSQPSTFAQAAKLRRMAVTKEKELAKIQESHSKDIKLSYDSYLKVLMIVKVFTYFGLICWFWGVPVAATSKQLVQPFGRMLSWRAGGPLNDNVMGTLVCSMTSNQPSNNGSNFWHSLRITKRTFLILCNFVETKLLTGCSSGVLADFLNPVAVRES